MCPRKLSGHEDHTVAEWQHDFADCLLLFVLFLLYSAPATQSLRVSPSPSTMTTGRSSSSSGRDNHSCNCCVLSATNRRDTALLDVDDERLPLGQLFDRAAVASRRDARRDRVHRGPVKRIGRSSPFERRKAQLYRLHCSYTRPVHVDALATKDHLAMSVAPSVCAAPGIRPPLRAAQGLAIGLHHGRKHLLARVYAQPEKRVLHILQHACHRQRQLDLNVPTGTPGGPQMLRGRLHLGGSFHCLAAPCISLQGKGTATFRSVVVQQFLGHRPPNPSQCYGTLAILPAARR